MFDLYRICGPLVRTLPAEAAHRLTLRVLSTGLLRGVRIADDPRLAVDLWGRHFPNPIGLAAGFDKNGEVPDAMLAMGFGFVEIGSITPEPQAGNSPPRLFRLPEDGAVINRMGFNNEGMRRVASRLAGRRRTGMVGINLGRNKETADPTGDYERGVAALAVHADYLVINVSSPNTPGLRALQGRASLEALLGRIQPVLAEQNAPPPLLLKIAPDLESAALHDIATVAIDFGLAGLIVSNTTTARPEGLRSRHAGESGGLSGLPLFEPSTRMLRTLYRLTEGRVPLIGTGGVSTPAHAYAKIRAGATLVQLYTALVYQGPGLIGRLTRGLVHLLQADGYATVAAAVGADHR